MVCLVMVTFDFSIRNCLGWLRLISSESGVPGLQRASLSSILGLCISIFKTAYWATRPNMKN
ncbi:hypothetical protein BpHYR1_021829 [Brachionus plicatilis]|uniref:Uncharacterized protein n=1 Tax=Brachionus plicatilis TaxID=10195 RepID=A0A3M7T4G9_BRAPC|nr:hypothetical protein BpHYR1_021829 [Brachionus plicatilis]